MTGRLTAVRAAAGFAARAQRQSVSAGPARIQLLWISSFRLPSIQFAWGGIPSCEVGAVISTMRSSSIACGCIRASAKPSPKP